jgi:hypothetical protein
MLKITFILIFLSALVSAQAASPELKSYSVKLEHLSNRTKGSTEELSWDSASLKCQGRYDSLPWKVFSEKACRDLAQAFESSRSALLTAQKSLAKQKHPALHQPRGLLKWTVKSKDGANNYDWMVNLATSPICTDPELKNCHEPQLDQPSTLAQKLRETLTQSLGRLPPPEATE